MGEGGAESEGQQEEEEHEDRVVNRLYRNNGDGTFTDVAHQAGVEGYPEEHHDHEHEHEGEESASPASIPSQEDGHDDDLLEEGGAFTGASWVDYNLDGLLDLMVTSRTFGPVLYENHGDGTFEYASEEAGFLEEHEHEEHGHEEHGAETQEEGEHEEEHEFYAVEHAAWGDFDNDGDLDVFFSIAVAHDHEDEHDHEGEADPAAVPQQDGHDEEEHAETENRFFVNNGDGTFTEMTDEAGLGVPNVASSNSAVWGDYDNDGWLDLFVCNIGSVNEETAVPQHLYHNNGDGTFTDVFESSGMDPQYYLFNAAWADLNNDGWLDLLTINHPDHEDYPAGVLYPFPHPVYMNNGDGTFININATVDQAVLDTGIVDINHLIAVSCGDIENDGDLDFIFTENHADGPTLLYANHAAGENNWLKLKLAGDGPNPFAFGARVVATAGEATMIRQCGFGDTGFGSQSSSTIHFGLGDASSAQIRVIWPDGAHELFGNVEAGQMTTLTRGEGVETPITDWQVH